jgi:hypothetical protein
LGFHDTLDFYGCSYSAFFVTRLCIKEEDRFRKFMFGNRSFEFHIVKDVTTEIIKSTYDGVKVWVSSKERTFLDCLERPKAAGGWEEIFKRFLMLDGVDVGKVSKLLKERESQSLVRRVGMILEMLQEDSPFFENIDQHLGELEELVESLPRYLHPQGTIRYSHGTPGYQHGAILAEPWRLYIPKRFEIAMRGRPGSFIPLYE